MPERCRVIIDTNILISRLLLKDSQPARAMDRAIETADLLVSDATLEELAEVLARPKFDSYLTVADRQEFIRRYMQLAQIITVHTDINDCRDPGDDKYLALAVDGNADCILSGDADLLSMHPFRDVAILSPADFLSQYGTSPSQ